MASAKAPALCTVLSLAFGALGLIAILMHHESTQRLEAEIGTQLSELATHVARRLDRSMFERWRDLQIAATHETLRRPDVPLAAKRDVLRQLQQTYPACLILLADPNGKP